MLKFDDCLLETARAVFALNPSARAQHNSPEELAGYMRGIAHQMIEGEGATFCGTLGFYLTGFEGHQPGVTIVRATVAAFLVNRAIERGEIAA